MTPTLGHQLQPGSPEYNQYVNYAEQYGQSKGLPPGVATSLMTQESHVAPDAISPTQATGLMQGEPGNGNPYGYTQQQLLDPKTNIQAGIDTLLKYQNELPNNDLRSALYAYNWGIGHVLSGRTPPPQVVNYANRVLNGAQNGGSNSTGSNPLDGMSPSNPTTFWYKNVDGSLEPGVGNPPAGNAPIGYDPNYLPIYQGGAGSKNDGISAIGFKIDSSGNYVPVFSDGSIGIYSPSVPHPPSQAMNDNFSSSTPFNSQGLLNGYNWSPNFNPSAPPSGNYNGQGGPSLIPTSLTTNGNATSPLDSLFGNGYNNATGTYLANPLNNPSSGGSNLSFNDLGSLLSGNPFNTNNSSASPQNSSSSDPFGNLLGNFFGNNGNGFLPANPSSNNSAGNYGPNNTGSGNPFDINSMLSGLFGNNSSPTTSNSGNAAMPVIQFPGLNGYGGTPSNNPATNANPTYQNNDWLQNPTSVPWAAYSPTVGGGSAPNNALMPTIQFPGLNNANGYGAPGPTGNNGSNNPAANNPFDINSMLSGLFGNSNSSNPAMPTIQFPGLNNGGSYNAPSPSNNPNNQNASNPFDINSMLSGLFGNSSPNGSAMPTIQFPGLNGSGNYGSPNASSNDGATNGPSNPISNNPFDINSMLSGLFGNNTGTSSMPTIQFPGLNGSGNYSSPAPSNNSSPSNPGPSNPFDINSMMSNLFGNSNSGSSSMPTIQFPGLNNGGSYSAPSPSSNTGNANSSNPFDINSMMSNLFGGSNSGNASMPTIQFPGLNSSGNYGAPAPSGNNTPARSSSPTGSGNPFDINSMLSSMFGGSNSGNSPMPTIQFPGLNSGSGSNPSNNAGTNPISTTMPTIQFPGLDSTGSSPTTMGSPAPADNSTAMPTIQFPGLGQSTVAPPVDTSQSAPPVDTSQSMPPVGASQSAPPMDLAQSAPPVDPSQSAPPMDPGAFNFGMGGMGGAGSGSRAPTGIILPSQWQFMEARLNFRLASDSNGAVDQPLFNNNPEMQHQLAAAGPQFHHASERAEVAHLHG